jgi:hypothetical protein
MSQAIGKPAALFGVVVFMFFLPLLVHFAAVLLRG